MAGDTRTGVTIHRTTPELDAGPIAAQEAFDVRPDDDAGAVFARSAEIAARLIGDVLAGAAVRAAARRRHHVRREDHARGSRPRPHPPGARERRPRARAVTAHRRARDRRRAPAHRLEGARRGRRLARAARGAARGRQAHAVRGLPARPPLMAAVSPARRVAYEVLLRVFEQDAYADRVFRTAARDLDERERAFAQRLAYGAVQRVRTLDYAIDTLGKRPVAQARSAGARSASARRVSARLHRHRAARRRERVGRARAPRAARARGPVHERRHAPPHRGHRATARVAARRRAEGVVSRLDRRDVRARPRPAPERSS